MWDCTKKPQAVKDLQLDFSYEEHLPINGKTMWVIESSPTDPHSGITVRRALAQKKDEDILEFTLCED